MGFLKNIPALAEPELATVDKIKDLSPALAILWLLDRVLLWPEKKSRKSFSKECRNHTEALSKNNNHFERVLTENKNQTLLKKSGRKIMYKKSLSLSGDHSKKYM